MSLRFSPSNRSRMMLEAPAKSENVILTMPRPLFRRELGGCSRWMPLNQPTHTHTFCVIHTVAQSCNTMFFARFVVTTKRYALWVIEFYHCTWCKVIAEEAERNHLLCSSVWTTITQYINWLWQNKLCCCKAKSRLPHGGSQMLSMKV